MKNVKVGGSGCGFCGLLTIAFVVLKLLDKINWGWKWVLSPLWIPLAIVLVISIGILLGFLIYKLIKKQTR